MNLLYSSTPDSKIITGICRKNVLGCETPGDSTATHDRQQPSNSGVSAPHTPAAWLSLFVRLLETARRVRSERVDRGPDHR